MRIGNPVNRNNSKVLQKKDTSKKEEKKQETSNRGSDQFNLSSEIVLLTHLLNAPEHQYRPLPFYFSDAAAKNARLIANISKSIQQKARLQYIDLNYDMISDLVISHANETAEKLRNTSHQTTDYQHISLQKNEASFFEHLHNKHIEYKLSPEIIATVVIAYSEYMQNHKKQASNQKEQIHLLLNTINGSNKPQILNNKNLLVNLLKTLAA